MLYGRHWVAWFQLSARRGGTVRTCARQCGVHDLARAISCVMRSPGDAREVQAAPRSQEFATEASRRLQHRGEEAVASSRRLQHRGGEEKGRWWKGEEERSRRARCKGRLNRDTQGRGGYRIPGSADLLSASRIRVGSRASELFFAREAGPRNRFFQKRKGRGSPRGPRTVVKSFVTEVEESHRSREDGFQRPAPPGSHLPCRHLLQRAPLFFRATHLQSPAERCETCRAAVETLWRRAG